MEPTNGLEAAIVLLAECDPAPLIILLTGVADPEVVEEALRVGIRAYVSKTRLSEDLIPAIHSVLAGSQFTSVQSDGTD
jgi:DNA-binding NarL/FixJ family response regulator